MGERKTPLTKEEILEELNAINIFCANRLAALPTEEEQSRRNGAQVLAVGVLFEMWMRTTPERRATVVEGINIIADNLVEKEKIGYTQKETST